MADVLIAVAGAAIVVAIGIDIAITLLHPSARGPVSEIVNRSAWRLVRAFSPNRNALSYAGPAAIFTSVLMWVVGLWFGCALVYMTAMDAGDALYTSGEAVSTVGFGNVEFDPEWLRYVAVAEAAGGLGAFTAAIAYVLSVYPLVSDIRASALFATLIAEAGDTSQVSVLTRRLIESHEHVKRFPVLYYFESGHHAESLIALLRAAVRMAAIVREAGDDRRAVPLERALNRLFDDLEQDYIGGGLKRRGRELEAGSFAERAEAVIGALAEEHRAPHATAA